MEEHCHMIYPCMGDNCHMIFACMEDTGHVTNPCMEDKRVVIYETVSTPEYLNRLRSRMDGFPRYGQLI